MCSIIFFGLVVLRTCMWSRVMDVLGLFMSFSMRTRCNCFVFQAVYQFLVLQWLSCSLPFFQHDTWLCLLYKMLSHVISKSLLGILSFVKNPGKMQSIFHELTLMQTNCIHVFFSFPFWFLVCARFWYYLASMQTLAVFLHVRKIWIDYLE